ncbi:co-chaperone GroES [Rickettsiella grylli]|uniref:Co-chaperonin GroES n=1 Tax=Rickettsiella grylli TaxID=59196 RepID=A8PNY2_9COXI|nr:co-chaperone GroES [Rickettsiella grylli]EDP46171.1 chaperonin GroS [Rickettsiella grylli]OJA00573.1 co-chaperone GroES [Rickettsiella grylli]
MSVALEKPLVESLVPMNDRILVKRDDEEEKSVGGIVIPDTAKEKPVRGLVVAVGNGKRLKSGQIQALTIKVGDKIYFGKYSGTEIKLDGKEYLIMREDDVLALIND